jgi:RNA polymerase sigma factor (sigma-70 family)
MTKTDIELWRDILKGETGAWRMLVNRYQALVYAIPIRSGLSAPDSADCFQQTWMALYENRRNIKEPSRIAAWLVTTAKRESLRLIRQSCRDNPNADMVEKADTGLLPDEELIQLERQAQLEIAIKELDQRCRKLVTSFFYADEKISYDEIASMLGISVNSLGPARRRCLNRLKKILLEMGFDEARNSDQDTL